MKSVWVMMLLHCAFSQKFKVVGPDSPVVAVAGSDVVLPCSVRRLDQSSLSAVDMTIKWTRSDLGDALVHFYENHKDVNTGQIPQYRGRTALFTEELQNGNVSLSLSKVNTRDEGEYGCRVDSESYKHDYSFNLRVEVIGERPVISVESYDSNSEQFSLLCESKGWFPDPDLQWLNSKGENVTAGDPEIQRHAELFTVKRSFTVHKNNIDTFYCRATLGEHTKQEEIKAEAFYERKWKEEVERWLKEIKRTEEVERWLRERKWTEEVERWLRAGIGIAVAVILVLILAGIALYKYKERKRRIAKVEKERKRLIAKVEKGFLFLLFVVPLCVLVSLSLFIKPEFQTFFVLQIVTLIMLVIILVILAGITAGISLCIYKERQRLIAEEKRGSEHTDAKPEEI